MAGSALTFPVLFHVQISGAWIRDRFGTLGAAGMGLNLSVKRSAF